MTVTVATNEIFSKIDTTKLDSLDGVTDSLGELTAGITALKDGSMELSEGLKTFNEQGIQKITELASGDLANTMARLKVTIDVSEDYYNFTGISDDMSGQVKFIYRTDEISAD